MADHENASDLPQVDDSDLSLILYEDITDPTHKARFERFAHSNPILAREIIRRAHLDSRIVSGSVEIDSAIINAVSLAIDALESAARRQHEASGAVFDEDRRRSDEPDGDRQVE